MITHSHTKASISPARATAFEILLRVQRENAYASELLHSPQSNRLSAADHGLVTELVMGVLRWQSFLDREIAGASSQKLARLDIEVLCALRMGLYQLRFLDRIPARAAIHESVEQVKRAGKSSAAGFVNAVLRKLSTIKHVFDILAVDNVEAIATQLAHPQWLVQRWQRRYGVEATRKICAYDQQVPQTAIRVWDSVTEQELRADGIEFTGGVLLNSTRRIVCGDVTHSQAFREGRVAVQDEASQLVAALVGKGARILDCCAAPGGKTAILTHSNPQAEVVAVELHPHRARLLRKLARSPMVRVVTADARALPLGPEFDRALVDVPCSGTGTLARNPEIKWRLRPEDLADLQTRQIAILRSAMSKVAPGGKIVYSTCSLEQEENAGVIEQVLMNDKSFHLVDARVELERLRLDGELAWQDLKSLTDGPYLRTIPGIHPCDGFFAAVLEKAGTAI